MQVLDFNRESLEKIVAVGWKRAATTGFVACDANATYRVTGKPIKGDPENMMWTVSIDHSKDDWRSVRMTGEDAIVVLARARRRFKDNLKLLRLSA